MAEQKKIATLQVDKKYNKTQYAEVQPNTLRCWQHGELIVSESGVLSAQGALPANYVSQSGERIALNHYGETFCVYIGKR